MIGEISAGHRYVGATVDRLRVDARRLTAARYIVFMMGVTMLVRHQPHKHRTQQRYYYHPTCSE